MSYIRLQAAISRLSDRELARLDNWMHQEIEDRAEEVEEQKRPGREVIARVVKASGTMQLELVRCGKMRCKSCPHGPYWYRYWKEAGRTKSKYVVKSSQAEKIKFADRIAAARELSGSKLSISPVITSR